MVRVGKVLGNLMVDVHPTNTKLRDRAVRIVGELTGADAAVARLKDLLEFHGGTMAGKEAILLYADIQYDKKQYDEALTHYVQAERAMGDDPVLGAAARRGLAATYESKGDHTHAIEILEKLYASVGKGANDDSE